MSKRKKDPLLEALKDGRSYTWTIPEGGNLASMRKAIKHGQTLTMSPITDVKNIQVGNLVLVKWHQSDIFHIVGDIQENQYLIVNSLGKENGWVEAKEILGKITKIVEPEPRPDVQTTLEQLERSYRDMVQQQNITEDDAKRLLSIVDDLRWYAERLGADQWDIMPRDNLWSFHQNLWKLTRQAKSFIEQDDDKTSQLIDQGKRCVGLASEIVSLFEQQETKIK